MIKRFGFLLTVLIWGVGTAVHAAEPLSVSKIGIVNLGKLFDQFEGTKASESDLEKVSKEKSTVRERMVSEIKSMKEELVLLNDVARREKQQVIDQRIKDLAQFDQEARGLLVKKRDESLKGILDQIEEVVTTYAKANGYELILSDRAVLYGIETINLTEEILKILNQKTSKKSS